MDEVQQQALLALAAIGDPDAQSLLTSHLVYGEFPAGVTRGERLAAAEIFARLASKSGRNKDRGLLAGVLMLQVQEMEKRGDLERRAVFVDEVAEILWQLADNGDEAGSASLIGLLSDAADNGCEVAAIQLNFAVQKYGAKAASNAQLLMSDIQGE